MRRTIPVARMLVSLLQNRFGKVHGHHRTIRRRVWRCLFRHLRLCGVTHDFGVRKTFCAFPAFSCTKIGNHIVFPAWIVERQSKNPAAQFEAGRVFGFCLSYYFQIRMRREIFVLVNGSGMQHSATQNEASGCQRGKSAGESENSIR